MQVLGHRSTAAGFTGGSCVADANCRLVQVLRDPVDRFLSAMSFKRDDALNAPGAKNRLCKAFLASRTNDDCVADHEAFDAACLATDFNIYGPQSWWTAGRERDIEFLCFDRIDEEWAAKIVPHCANCTLRRTNQSRRESPPTDAVRRFVAEHFAEDLALYERHCSRAPGNSARDRQSEDV